MMKVVHSYVCEQNRLFCWMKVLQNHQRQRQRQHQTREPNAAERNAHGPARRTAAGGTGLHDHHRWKGGHDRRLRPLLALQRWGGQHRPAASSHPEPGATPPS